MADQERQDRRRDETQFLHSLNFTTALRKGTTGCRCLENVWRNYSSNKALKITMTKLQQHLLLVFNAGPNVPHQKR